MQACLPCKNGNRYVVEKENTQGLELWGNEVRILTDNHSLEIEMALPLF